MISPEHETHTIEKNPSLTIKKVKKTKRKIIIRKKNPIQFDSDSDSEIIIKKKTTKKINKKTKKVDNKEVDTKEVDNKEVDTKKVDTKEVDTKEVEKKIDNENNSGTHSLEDLKQQFLDSMDDKMKIAYKIAQEHLETSFDLEKCIAFQKYKSKISPH